ncbi:DUF1345 domain-containing protein [Brachybacterium sp. AOP29-B2-41]|uniref:DUF1345 domain-containing protein n=1 Tax=Brachybacterium sp. AOP29-B2-41 TaxID=3457704 RepID=UPI0040341FA9
MADQPDHTAEQALQPDDTTEQTHQSDGAAEQTHQADDGAIEQTRQADDGAAEQSPSEQSRSAADRPVVRERVRPARRRRLPRHRRSLRRRLLSENLRLLASSVLSLGIGAVIVVPLASSLRGAETAEVQLPLFLMLLIITVSLYSLTFAGLTLWVLTAQPRHRLVAAARLPRARRHVRFYRWYMGRSSSFSEVMQMLLIAVLAALLLIVPPPGIPIAALLALTAGAVVTAWIGAVMTFAVEYAAEDSHATAFSLPGTTGKDRGIAEYVYGAVLIQASSGAGDLTPLTASARRLVRNHVILAHVTSTIIVTLGVSAVVTAVT